MGNLKGSQKTKSGSVNHQYVLISRKDITPLEIDAGKKHSSEMTRWFASIVDPIKASGLGTGVSIFISMIGAGILGLPYAFRQVGIIGALIILPFCALMATYAMVSLVECKERLVEQGKSVNTYGDIALYSIGRKGAILIDSLIVITQVSFCVSYLIFISENMASVVQAMNPDLIVLFCIPGLIALVLIRNIASLSPFAMIANVAMLVGISVVVTTDIELFEEHELESTDTTLNSLVYSVVLGNVPYFFGIVIYCFEGVGVILTLHDSIEDKRGFTSLLTVVMLLVTLVYLVFGLLGYLAYGATTEEIITLNLGDHLATKIVKVSLSIGLFFIYPLMMMPVFSMLDLSSYAQHWPNWVKPVFRVSVVFLTAILAVFIPSFADFISLIGAGACAALELIFPALLHLHIFGNRSILKAGMNYFVCLSGFVFGFSGTVTAAKKLFS